MSVLQQIHFITQSKNWAVFVLKNNAKTIYRQLRGLPSTLDKAKEEKEFDKENVVDSSTMLETEYEVASNSSNFNKVQNAVVPTFNLAAYVNKSSTLQECIKLGVNLHSIERRKGLAEFMLRLDFEQNIKPCLIFLKDQGISPELFGELITKNPLIFKVNLSDLETRVNYLCAKQFTPQQRQRIFTLNPFWLMFPTRRIDRRLAFFQKEFKLSGDNIRFLASKQPNLITYNMSHIQQSTFCIREEMGFQKEDLKCLLLSKPRLWMISPDILIERFSYVHHNMQLSHDMLLCCPEVLTSRGFRLRQRHEFLKKLGRSQYDPEKDLYVSPKAVVKGNDFQFVRDVAKSDMKTYDLYLNTQ